MVSDWIEYFSLQCYHRTKLFMINTELPGNISNSVTLICQLPTRQFRSVSCFNTEVMIMKWQIITDVCKGIPT